MSEGGFGSQVVTQIGLIVRDIEQTSAAFSRILGLPLPEVMITDTVDIARTEYRGESSPAQAKLAFFRLGQVSLELIEPMGGPSTWQEHLDTKGEGVHHIAFEVPETAAASARLHEHGLEEVQHGYFPGGQYTYFETTSQLGVILELLEFFKK
ncbi:MAG: VOC family protein [Anaerolineae bacterium]|nr:VOC family protein [Anaerolineae bacterium]